jgi:hypothetical protein
MWSRVSAQPAKSSHVRTLFQPQTFKLASDIVTCADSGRLHPTVVMQIIFENGVRANKRFRLGSPEKEGLVSLVAC